MKVWELIAELNKIPAGADVFAGTHDGKFSMGTEFIEIIDPSEPSAGIYIRGIKERT